MSEATLLLIVNTVISLGTLYSACEACLEKTITAYRSTPAFFFDLAVHEKASSHNRVRSKSAGPF